MKLWKASEREETRKTRIGKEEEEWKAPKVRISLWKSEGYDILTPGTTHIFYHFASDMMYFGLSPVPFGCIHTIYFVRCLSFCYRNFICSDWNDYVMKNSDLDFIKEPWNEYHIFTHPFPFSFLFPFLLPSLPFRLSFSLPSPLPFLSFPFPSPFSLPSFTRPFPPSRTWAAFWVLFTITIALSSLPGWWCVCHDRNVDYCGTSFTSAGWGWGC